jgi:hypothetical protein
MQMWPTKFTYSVLKLLKTVTIRFICEAVLLLRITEYFGATWKKLLIFFLVILRSTANFSSRFSRIYTDLILLNRYHGVAIYVVMVKWPALIFLSSLTGSNWIKEAVTWYFAKEKKKGGGVEIFVHNRYTGWA